MVVRNQELQVRTASYQSFFRSSRKQCAAVDTLIGIYFIQSKVDASLHDLIVAKAVSRDDFDRQLFVNEIAREYFKIRCPDIRYIAKEDAEFKELEESVKKVFYSFHQEVYDAGWFHFIILSIELH